MESKPVYPHPSADFSAAAIQSRIADYLGTGYSVRDYCYATGDLTETTLEAWLEQYHQDKAGPGDADDGFMTVNVTERRKPGPKKQLPAPPAVASQPLFARVGEVEIYQQVSAAYPKSLRS
jgi:hypothetical protein